MIPTDVGNDRLLVRVAAAMDAGHLLVPPPDFALDAETTTYASALRAVLDVQADDDRSPLHLYAHVPLCDEHCSFCMYYFSPTDRRGSRAKRCADQLASIVRLVAPDSPRPAAAAYVGGGTPSVLSANDLERVLTTLFDHFPPEPSARVTVEMSPRSASPDKIRAVRSCGTNRISFGVQSFDPAVLAAVRRAPVDAAHLERCVAVAAASGMVEINADLMHGLPDQPIEDLAHGVTRLAAVEVSSITLYRQRPTGRDPTLRAGLDGYLRLHEEVMDRALDAAARCGFEPNGSTAAECVRLVRSAHWRRLPRLPLRNWYRTQYDPVLDNALVGFGSGAQSFARGQLAFTCPHVPDFDRNLGGRIVQVRRADENDRHRLAVVRRLYWDRAVSDCDLTAAFPSSTLSSNLAEELGWLADQGWITWDGDRVTVACTGAEWAKAEKVLYPRRWVERELTRIGM